MNAKGKETGKPRKLSRAEQEGLTWSDLLLWQTWQQHAKLRKRFLDRDPQAVRMIDALVSDFYVKWELEVSTFPLPPDLLITELARGQAALGQVLPDEECYAIMRTPEGGIVPGGN